MRAFCQCLCASALLLNFGCGSSPKPISKSSESSEYFVPSQGDSLFVVVLGEGPPLLVVHGGPGLNHNYFRPHLDVLAEDFTLIYYDQRACGKSSINVDNQTMTIASWGVDMESIRTYFGFEKWYVLAHSFGALPAINYAKRYQDKLDGLLLMAPSAPSSNYRQIEVDELGNRIDDAQALRRVEIISSPGFVNGEMPTIIELMKLNFSNVIYDPNKLDELNLTLPPDQMRRSEQISVLQPELDEYNYEPLLTAIRVPTLVLIGAYDPMILGGGPVYEQKLPNVTYTTIAECGHFPFLEKPAAVRSHIRNFVAAQ